MNSNKNIQSVCTKTSKIPNKLMSGQRKIDLFLAKKNRDNKKAAIQLKSLIGAEAERKTTARKI